MKNGASDLTDVRPVQVDLDEMQIVGVEWCGERQFADLCGELRMLRAESRKLQDWLNRSMDLNRRAQPEITRLEAENVALRAQLYEARELAERYLAERA